MTLNNESDELNRYRIEKFGLVADLRAFFSSCWLGVRKPMRKFYERGLGMAQADPESIAVHRRPAAESRAGARHSA